MEAGALEAEREDLEERAEKAEKAGVKANWEGVGEAEAKAEAVDLTGRCTF